MGARGVIGTVVVVGVLVGGAWVADGVVRDRTEDQLAEELRAQIPGLDTTPDVTINGFPFLTQVAAGELEDVHLTAPEATLEGLRLEEIDVRLYGVSTDQPTTAREAYMTAVAPMDGITAALGLDVQLEAEEGQLKATLSLLGVPIDVLLEPQAAGRDIQVNVTALRAVGATVDPSSVPGLDGLDGVTVPVEGLPEGLEITDLTVEDRGVWLEAEGTDVVFEPLDEQQ
jgi:hypothetical protein